MTTITHTIYRDDDQTEIVIETTGRFSRHGLESWEFTSGDVTVNLTSDEVDEICEKLIQAHGDDWDEDTWQAEREAS